MNKGGKNLKNITCCFSGHRFEEELEKEKEIRPLIEKAIDNAIDNGYNVFITGMAVGTDVWAAEIVIEKKKINKELRLVCALPYPNFDKKRNDDEKKRYQSILDNADEVVEISQHYFRSCFQKRNDWMVDSSNRVIAAFARGKGGTKNTIDYAKRKGIEIHNVLMKDVENK